MQEDDCNGGGGGGGGQGQTSYIATCDVEMTNTYILLHDWEGNTGEYSARGWQYWPDRREGQYELNIHLYCPTQIWCEKKNWKRGERKRKRKEKEERKKKK